MCPSAPVSGAQWCPGRRRLRSLATEGDLLQWFVLCRGEDHVEDKTGALIMIPEMLDLKKNRQLWGCLVPEKRR